MHDAIGAPTDLPGEQQEEASDRPFGCTDRAARAGRAPPPRCSRCAPCRRRAACPVTATVAPTFGAARPGGAAPDQVTCLQVHDHGGHQRGVMGL
jgi:hypothetical protein